MAVAASGTRSCLGHGESCADRASAITKNRPGTIGVMAHKCTSVCSLLNRSIGKVRDRQRLSIFEFRLDGQLSDITPLSAFLSVIGQELNKFTVSLP